jgi:hypothetical protein
MEGVLMKTSQSSYSVHSLLPVIWIMGIALISPNTGIGVSTADTAYRSLPNTLEPSESNADAADQALIARRKEQAELRKSNYPAWRAQFPARDLSPRPTDGANLALTIRKLEQGFDPPRPFVIWAVGSSWTRALGEGDTLKHRIRERFPNAPEIVYKRAIGSSMPYQYARGWVNQFVIAEQPDLILFYCHGETADLEAMLGDIKSKCTADVILGSVHNCRNEELTDAVIDNRYWANKAKVASKYNCEWVNNRRECVQYMQEHKLPLFTDTKGKDAFLADKVHQSAYGSLIINENFFRHFAHAQTVTCQPEEVERRLDATDCKSIRENETIKPGEGWLVSGKTLACSKTGASLKMTFQGNRIDLIGVQSSNGGTVRVLLDGQPARNIPAFFTTNVKTGKHNSGLAGYVKERAPHWIQLGRDIVPQTWTISTTDENNNYELKGSVTGADGKGDTKHLFKSNSGQIIIDPYFWRNPTGYKSGETWVFDVVRTTLDKVSFAGQTGKLFRIKVSQNLSNSEHNLELITESDGSVAIVGFDVFEPPHKAQISRN